VSLFTGKIDDFFDGNARILFLLRSRLSADGFHDLHAFAGDFPFVLAVLLLHSYTFAKTGRAG
jgi:hypothetical protein